MVSAALIAVAGILMFVGLKSTFYIIKVLSGVAWVGLGIWWVYSPFTTAGTPPHTIALMVTFFVGIACFFWSFWSNRYDKNGRESGGRFRIPFMQSDEDEELSNQQRKLPTRQERVDAYYSRLDSALRGERKRR